MAEFLILVGLSRKRGPVVYLEPFKYNVKFKQSPYFGTEWHVETPMLKSPSISCPSGDSNLRATSSFAFQRRQDCTPVFGAT